MEKPKPSTTVGILFIGAVLVQLAFIVGFTWAAIHFIAKYW